jgi:hypothetical protein
MALITSETAASRLGVTLHVYHEATSLFSDFPKKHRRRWNLMIFSDELDNFIDKHGGQQSCRRMLMDARNEKIKKRDAGKHRVGGRKKDDSFLNENLVNFHYTISLCGYHPRGRFS